MNARVIRTAVLTACLSLTAPIWAQTSSWLHVEVNEGGDKASQVNVNLPLSIAKAALGMAPQKFTEKALEKLSDHDISIADIRTLWAEIKQAGNAEFVTVQEKDETVRVARDGEWMRIRVEKTTGKAERVHVDIPLRVVDALLSGDSESFNLLAAVNELEGNNGDIVRVEDGNDKVRVWIASN